MSASLLLFARLGVADAPASRYVVEAGTVRDTSTGLTWQQLPAESALTWADAARYCTTLSLGGAAGWRLPSVKELETLVDESRIAPSIDPKIFPETPNEFFWTVSKLPSYSDYAWTVSFQIGRAYFFGMTSRQWVRCVR